MALNVNLLYICETLFKNLYFKGKIMVTVHYTIKNHPTASGLPEQLQIM
jgi:hypothetical protein